MKTTVVPAQVTTVEDKVAGNLNFTQLLLLTAPVFLNVVLYMLVPPMFKFTSIKTALGVTVTIACLTLAIRIKGKLVMTWAVVISRYLLRPRYYLFNKNDAYLRNFDNNLEVLEVPLELISEIPEHRFRELVPISERIRLESAITDPSAQFHLGIKKGVMRVHIREIKKEGV